MVTFGAWEWVERSLGALHEHTTLPYELIVVDNASPDGTGARLGGTLTGATLIRNDRNVGFGPATNQGALHAVGRFVCLLNSDTLVQANWLEPLVEALERHLTVGAVVPRKLNLDGTLQEACSMVDRVGRVHMYGLGGNPLDPAYLFPRRVDFGGAACLLVRREVFLAVGGFDPAFEMAYFEDVDLCFTLRERGSWTLYEPRSTVQHVGGASGAAEDRRRYVAPNHARFMGKWAHTLARRPELPEGSPPHRQIALRDVDALDRFLIVSDCEAEGTEGGDRRARRLALELARSWPGSRVTLLLPGPAPDIADMLQGGVEVLGEPGDLHQCLDDRLFHYSMVIVRGGSTLRRLGERVRRSQAQAPVVYDTDTGDDRAAPDGSDVEALGMGDVVWCQTESVRRRVNRLAAGIPTFLVSLSSPGTPGTTREEGEELVEAMSHLGIAPPCFAGQGDPPNTGPRLWPSRRIGEA